MFYSSLLPQFTKHTCMVHGMDDMVELLKYQNYLLVPWLTILLPVSLHLLSLLSISYFLYIAFGDDQTRVIKYIGSMETASNGTQSAVKSDEEKTRYIRRMKLRELNANPQSTGKRALPSGWINQSWKVPESSRLDSSLKRHTALIKRMRQSIGAENREHILKDIDSLSLEKYIDEIAGAAVEGVGRCKTEKDIWSAVEVCTLIPPGQLWLMSWPFWSKVISALHRRFPNAFTPALVSSFATALSAPSRGAMSALVPEQREKEDAARIMKQRPVLRICSELALVAIIRDSPKRSGGEWIMKCLKELVRVPVSSHLLVILNLEF